MVRRLLPSNQESVMSSRKKDPNRLHTSAPDDRHEDIVPVCHV